MLCFEQRRGAAWRPPRPDRRPLESSSRGGAAALPPVQSQPSWLPAPAALLALPRAWAPEWQRVRTVASMQPALRLAQDRGWLQPRARKPFAPPQARERAWACSPAQAIQVSLPPSRSTVRYSLPRRERGRQAPTSL